MPSFKSTVIVNDIRYDSLPGFSNRKAAEQSAAEVALVELVKSGNMKECISQPVVSSFCLLENSIEHSTFIWSQSFKDV